MRVLFLVTHTPNCEPFWRSLQYLGHEVFVEQYDSYAYDRQSELIYLAQGYRPDFIVYVGAYEPSHGKPVLSLERLLALKGVAPTVLLCGDAADAPWWPVLEAYETYKCFTVIVAMDGGASPVERFQNGLTLLTPLDPRPFQPRPWSTRSIRLGTVGGMGHRGGLISELQGRGLLDYRPGPVGRSYQEYADLLCDTQIVLNFPETGTGKFKHVKGRVVEAGFAGALVLEAKGSPLARWFTPGEDYFEYETVEDIAAVAGMMKTFPLYAGSGFSHKMVSDHGPDRFWGQVLVKLGLV